MNPAAPFCLSVRVYYEDTDAAGVVYHAAYVRFFERARTEYLRQADMDHRTVKEKFGVLFAIRALTLEYRHPAYLDDVLEIDARPVGRGRIYVDFAQTARRTEGRIIATAQVRVVCVTGEPLRAASLPPPLADKIDAHVR